MSAKVELRFPPASVMARYSRFADCWDRDQSFRVVRHQRSQHAPYRRIRRPSTCPCAPDTFENLLHALPEYPAPACPTHGRARLCAVHPCASVRGLYHHRKALAAVAADGVLGCSAVWRIAPERPAGLAVWAWGVEALKDSEEGQHTWTPGCQALRLYCFAVCRRKNQCAPFRKIRSCGTAPPFGGSFPVLPVPLPCAGACALPLPAADIPPAGCGDPHCLRPAPLVEAERPASVPDAALDNLPPPCPWLPAAGAAGAFGPQLLCRLGLSFRSGLLLGFQSGQLFFCPILLWDFLFFRGFLLRLRGVGFLIQ